MESNITLYYFIFNKPFSANKQHKYTHNDSKNKSFLYNTNGITHKSTHIHFYYSRPDNNYKNNTTCNSKFEWIFLYPVNA